MGRSEGCSELVNCVKTATKGCHICLWYPGDEAPSVGRDWIVDYEDIEEDEREGPDFAIDPDDGNLLTVRNIADEPRTFYLSLQEGVLGDEAGCVLETGDTRDDDGVHIETTTVILLIPPSSLIDVGYIACEEIQDVVIHSDIQVFKPRAADEFNEDAVIELKTFPLKGEEPFLCTQAAGGSLTHFAHAGTDYALDFRCEIGTPVRSVCDGRVIDVRSTNTCGGIDVDNLYKWNSITIQSSNKSLCFDYVHLSPDGITVKVDDLVVEGQIIAKSGDVGFTPEPHLHFQCLESSAADACSIPLKFRFGAELTAVSAEAGKYYPPPKTV